MTYTDINNIDKILQLISFHFPSAYTKHCAQTFVENRFLTQNYLLSQIYLLKCQSNLISYNFGFDNLLNVKKLSEFCLLF